MNGEPLDADQEGAYDNFDAIATEELCLDYLKEQFQTWREAWVDLIPLAPPHAVLAPPRPIFLWAIESGEIDTDPGGADDPADQVYFAVRDGLIKIGFSGSPRRRLSRACTITRTIVGGTLQEAMLHNLFRKSQVWREDRAEGSSAEWYKPTPMLSRLANAGEALARGEADAAVRHPLARYRRERYPGEDRVELVERADDA